MTRHLHRYPLVLLLFLSLSSWAAGARADSFTPTGSMTVPRTHHTATLLPNGKVLIVGGFIDPNASVPTAVAELYDPATGLFSATGNLGQARAIPGVVLLPNGKVLVVGGLTSGNTMTASAELYDPAAGAFTPTGSMSIPRAGFSANLLPSGKVLVVGGYNNSNVWNATAELYDPASGTFSLTGSLNTPRYGHSATSLADGRVLISGGNSFGAYTGALEFYDPATGVFVNAGGMLARAAHVAQLLPNGRVLLAGGAQPCCPGGLTTTAQLWDPSTSTITDVSPMVVARSYAGSVLLPNGKVLIAGGLYGGPGVVTNSAEIFDPTTNQFSATASMGAARFVFTTTLLPNGRVMVTGGSTANGPTYDPTAAAEIFSNRTLLVGITAEDSLWQYDEHGTFLGRFVAPGPAPYQDSQIAMAFGPDGNLYKAGSGGSANVVRVFSGTNGAYIRDLFPAGAGGLASAAPGLRFGSDGKLYVSAAWDSGKCSISRFDPVSGAYLGDLDADPACIDWPQEMTVGPDGYLYAGWSGPNGVYVKKYNTTTGVSLGNFTNPGAAGGGGFVANIAFGDDGRLYVADFGGQAVHRFDAATGAFLGNISASWPAGMVLGPNHDVYVSLRYNGVIADYDRTTGAYLGNFAAGLTEPTRLAWMPPDATPAPPSSGDTTPPVVTVPSNMTVNATSPSGATVTFTASATDDVDGPLPATCTPASGSTFPIGTTTVTCTATDSSSNTGSASFTVTVVNAVSSAGPASIWLGLKNSDDVGTRFDLLAELLRNGVVVATFETDNVPGGSSGFNNAVLRAVGAATSANLTFSSGDTLAVRLSVRIAATGHRSGTARLWYNDAAANSRFHVVLNGQGQDFYLVSGSALSVSAGTGPRSFVDVLVDRAVGGNPFKPFGTWSRSF